MADHPTETKSEIFQSYYRITFILKCCGLFPVVTDPEKRHRPRYRLLNILAILVAAFVYGYILVHYSLESEFIRLSTGSVIIQRMLDIFHITRYVMAVVVPAFVLLRLDKISRMIQGLQEVNALIMNFGGKLITEKLSRVDRLVRIVQLVALVVPFSCVVVFSVVWDVAFTNISVGLVFRISRLMCFFSFAQLWTQPTLLVMQMGGRFTALNQAVR